MIAKKKPTYILMFEYRDYENLDIEQYKSKILRILRGITGISIKKVYVVGDKVCVKLYFPIKAYQLIRGVFRSEPEIGMPILTRWDKTNP